MVEGINFTEYFREIIATGILITILLILRIVAKKIIVGFGRKSGLSMPRIKMVLKYKDLLLSILGFLSDFFCFYGDWCGYVCPMVYVE